MGKRKVKTYEEMLEEDREKKEQIRRNKVYSDKEVLNRGTKTFYIIVKPMELFLRIVLHDDAYRLNDSEAKDPWKRHRKWRNFTKKICYEIMGCFEKYRNLIYFMDNYKNYPFLAAHIKRIEPVSNIKLKKKILSDGSTELNIVMSEDIHVDSYINRVAKIAQSDLKAYDNADFIVYHNNNIQNPIQFHSMENISWVAPKVKRNFLSKYYKKITGTRVFI